MEELCLLLGVNPHNWNQRDGGLTYKTHLMHKDHAKAVRTLHGSQPLVVRGASNDHNWRLQLLSGDESYRGLLSSRS